MHESMERLYKFAKEKHKIGGQSALAEKLLESPQVVHNWEVRGLSKRGALKAQTELGCDANWLLGIEIPQVKYTELATAAAPTSVQEPSRWVWPFDEISTTQYAQLSADQRKDVEKYVLLQIKTREPPEKHESPEQRLRKIQAA